MIAKTSMVRFSTVLALCTLAFSAGCSKKAQDDESGMPMGGEGGSIGDSDSGSAMGLQTVYFAYDSYSLESETKSVLQANAQILTDKPSLMIQIEGHCDERGGIQYNIALGEKRANAAKKFLMDEGISADRVATVSYGKERPLDPGHTDESWSKNRRGNFVVTAQ